MSKMRISILLGGKGKLQNEGEIAGVCTFGILNIEYRTCRGKMKYPACAAAAAANARKWRSVRDGEFLGPIFRAGPLSRGFRDGVARARLFI